MEIGYILEKLRDLIFPPKCLLCSNPTSVGKSELCDDCLSRWRSLRAVKCPRCGETAERCRCHYPHPENGECAGALFFYDYSDSELADGKRLIYSLKRSRDRRVSRFIAREMAAMLLKYGIRYGIDMSSAIVTNAPRSVEAVREYGFDHASELARLTAYYIGAQYKSLFVNVGGSVQKTLSAADRKANVEEAISLHGVIPQGNTCILIDDVITTGATLGTCADQLCRGGADRVICATAAAVRNKTASAKAYSTPKQGCELWFKN